MALQGSSAGPSRPSSTTGSRMPRPSIAHYTRSASGSRLAQHATALPAPVSAPEPARATTLTDKDIDERVSSSVHYLCKRCLLSSQIARAVEAEVARRLEARLKEEDERRAREEEDRRAKEEEERLVREEEERRQMEEHVRARENGESPKELEIELRARLEELEQKLYVEPGCSRSQSDDCFLHSDNSSQEVQMVDVLSPVDKKRTGRAYVALARSHSEKYVYCVLSWCYD